VSVDGAMLDYGLEVALVDGDPVVDEQASDALRDQLRSDRGESALFFDRGPGYPKLSGGAAFADVDVR
jgi:N-methylhydantoinase B